MAFYIHFAALFCLYLGWTSNALPMNGQQVFSDRERNLFQEIMCLIKGLTPNECLADEGIGSVMGDLFPNNHPHARESRLLSNLKDAQESRKYIKFPVPLGNKRSADAFYSDWKRKK